MNSEGGTWGLAAGRGEGPPSLPSSHLSPRCRDRRAEGPSPTKCAGGRQPTGRRHLSRRRSRPPALGPRRDLALPSLELPGSRCRCHGLAALRHVGRHQALVPVGREAAQRKLSPSSLAERDTATSTRWSARNRAGGRRGQGHRWRGLRPAPGSATVPAGRGLAWARGPGLQAADSSLSASSSGPARGPRRAQARARLLSSLGLSAIPGPGAAVPPRVGTSVSIPEAGGSRTRPGNAEPPRALGPPGRQPSCRGPPWRPSGAPPGAASQGRPALPPGPTGPLYQPARGLAPGSTCACPATLLPGLSPGAVPGAHAFSALGSPGPRQVLGVSASSGKNPKCCGQTRRGRAHSVTSPGESAGRAPRARPAAARDQGRDAQAGQEAQGVFVCFNFIYLIYLFSALLGLFFLTSLLAYSCFTMVC